MLRPPGLTWQPDRGCPCRTRRKNSESLVHPLLEVVALLQLRIHAGRGHGRVLREVRGVLPLEVLLAVLRVWLATEVAVRSRDLVLRLTQLQRLRDGARAAVEVDLHDLRDRLRRQAARLRAVRLHEERERLRNADRVRELHERALAEAALHHRLGHLPADVRRRAIDLRRVLAGERAAAVRTPPTVRVDDDLAPGEPSVTLRAADDELARRVDVEVGVIAVKR